MTITGHDQDTEQAIGLLPVAPPPQHGLLPATARPVPPPRAGRAARPDLDRPAAPALRLGPPAPPSAPRPESRLKEALGIAGVMAIVVTAGVSLGFAWTSNDPTAGVSVASAADPGSVRGLSGLAPGGPPGVVGLPVSNPGATPLTLTGVSPQLSLLPSTCPSSAWLFTVPAQLPVVPAAGATQVPLGVALTADAPAGCQAVVTSLHAVVSATAGGLATSIDATTTVSTGRLGAPVATVGLDGGAVRVRATGPDEGPPPSGYTVDAVGPDGRHVPVCARPTVDVCVDAAAPGAVRRGYVVTAHAGSGWRRDSAQIEIWTPPPAPVLSLVGSGGSGQHLPDRDVVVSAPPAEGGYQVVITVDGVRVARLPVAAGAALDRSVRLTGLRRGPHQVLARASTHDAWAASAPLTFGADALRAGG